MQLPPLPPGPELMGVGSLLKKYTALLCTHIGDILPVAASVASTSWRHFAEVASVVEGDFTGTSSFPACGRVCCHRQTRASTDRFLKPLALAPGFLARAVPWLLWLLAALPEQPGQESVLWPWVVAPSCTVADTSAESVLAVRLPFSGSSRDPSKSQYRVMCFQAASVMLGHYYREIFSAGELVVNTFFSG